MRSLTSPAESANWQLIAFALGGVLVLQALTTFRLASAAHPVPYVVASQLADFIRAVRTVLPSEAATAQANLLRRGHALAAPAAAGFLKA